MGDVGLGVAGSVTGQANSLNFHVCGYTLGRSATCVQALLVTLRRPSMSWWRRT